MTVGLREDLRSRSSLLTAWSGIGSLDAQTKRSAVEQDEFAKGAKGNADPMKVTD